MRSPRRKPGRSGIGREPGRPPEGPRFAVCSISRGKGRGGPGRSSWRILGRPGQPLPFVLDTPINPGGHRLDRGVEGPGPDLLDDGPPELGPVAARVDGGRNLPVEDRQGVRGVKDADDREALHRVELLEPRRPFLAPERPLDAPDDRFPLRLDGLPALALPPAPVIRHGADDPRYRFLRTHTLSLPISLRPRVV